MTKGILLNDVIACVTLVLVVLDETEEVGAGAGAGGTGLTTGLTIGGGGTTAAGPTRATSAYSRELLAGVLTGVRIAGSTVVVLVIDSVGTATTSPWAGGSSVGATAGTRWILYYVSRF